MSRKKRTNISYKHIVKNIIRLLQKEEEENGEEIHSYDEWLELLGGDLRDED